MGDRLLAVNGVEAVGHARTTSLLKAAVGPLRLTILRPPPEEHAEAGSEKPHEQEEHEEQQQEDQEEQQQEDQEEQEQEEEQEEQEQEEEETKAVEVSRQPEGTRRGVGEAEAGGSPRMKGVDGGRMKDGGTKPVECAAKKRHISEKSSRYM